MKLTIEEAAYFLYSEHGMEESDGRRLSAGTIKEWIQQRKIKASYDGNRQTIDKSELEDFLEDLKWEGTAYEKGIDDQTKIERLLKEIHTLKRENEQLKEDISKYEMNSKSDLF